MIDRAAHAVKPLAARQRDALRVVAEYRQHTGESPSVSYVARRLGVSRQTAQEYLDQLFRKGWLTSASPAGLRCIHVAGRNS